MMKNRAYRLIHGISYPNLFQGEQPVKLSSEIETREDFYNDPAVRLNNNDCEYFKNKPIWVEHEKDEVGIITNAYKDSDNHMRIDARIFVDTPRGQQMFKKIENGELKCLSVGYGVCINENNERVEKNYREVSLCNIPFFKGAEVKITATGNQFNNSINNFDQIEKNNLVFFKVMAENNTQTEPETVSKKDTVEQMKQYDIVLQQMEALKKKLDEKEQAEKQKDEELKVLKSLEEQRRIQYAKDNEPKLKEYLETTKEQYGNELPPEFTQSMEKAFKTPEAKYQTEVVLASAMKYKEKEEENQKLQSTIAELMDKVKKFEEKQPLADAIIQSNQRRMGLLTEEPKIVTQKEIAIEASGGKPQMYDLFQTPSEQESILYEMTTGKKPELNVNASNNNRASIPKAPTHQFTSAFPNSMRHMKGASQVYDLLCSGNFSAVVPNVITKDTIEILEK